MTFEEIGKKIEEFRETYLGENFSWRKGQKEAIEELLLTYFSGEYDTVILDAPVGSGKSLIAMCFSWILNREGKSGYILASDLSLQDQYERDFEKYSLRWGTIKGIDNYLCTDNMQVNSIGTCRIMGNDPRSMPCYSGCPYFSARDYSSQTKTSLLNYAYWLSHMNYVNPDSELPLFPPRDFTICDEAHKLLDLMQSSYSPKFSKEIERVLERITTFFSVYKVANHHKELKVVMGLLNKMRGEEDKKELLEILKEMEEVLSPYKKSMETLKKKMKEKHRARPPKAWREAFFLSRIIGDLIGKIGDFCKIIEATGEENLIKNPVFDSISFNCLEEKYIMKKYFLQWTGFRVLMSATFADPKDYLRGISIKKAKYIKIPSYFPFEKSPIFFWPARRMNYSNIDKNLPWLIERIEEIMESHKEERGIIHTASYDLSLKIFSALSCKDRILVYNGSREKRSSLEELKWGERMVLMGPSLLEGLDLRDDFSRFSIFAKVPFPSLSDRFVRAKMERDPGWYHWRSIINLLQGTGRSIRNEDDWAITYILDGSFGDLLHRNRGSFPPEFISRIRPVLETAV